MEPAQPLSRLVLFSLLDAELIFLKVPLPLLFLRGNTGLGGRTNALLVEPASISVVGLVDLPEISLDVDGPAEGKLDRPPFVWDGQVLSPVHLRIISRLEYFRKVQLILNSL